MMPKLAAWYTREPLLRIEMLFLEECPLYPYTHSGSISMPGARIYLFSLTTQEETEGKLIAAFQGFMATNSSPSDRMAF
jgi:hypothetical protein